MSIFSERLTNARELKHWTRKRTASELQIPYQTYSNYENGKREPDVNTIARIAKTLNTTVDYLLGNTNDPEPVSNITSDDLDDMLNHARSFDGIPINDNDIEVMRSFLKWRFSNNK